MSILKETYSSFDLSQKKSDQSESNLLALYLTEFSFNQNVTFEAFVKIVLNSIKDFFENKLNARQLSALLANTFTHSDTKLFHEGMYLQEHNQLLALVSELSDLDWSSESENYREYIEATQKKWEEFVLYYETYFQK